MSNWVKTNLGNLGVVVTGQTPSKKNPEDWGTAIHFITPTDFKNYFKYAESSLRKLSIEGERRLIKKVLPKNAVLVTCIGSDMGKVAITSEKSITNQQINAIIPTEGVSADFIYYQLVNMYPLLKSLGSGGTAVPILNKSTFEAIECKVPSFHEQLAIAEVLSSIDDKIDLLNRQNETLEAMAQTLFRQWFIEEADESWGEVELGELVETVTGLSYKSGNLCASNIHMLNLKSFNRDGSIRLDGYKEFQGDFKDKHTCFNGDILVAHTDVTQDASLLGNAIEVINLYGAETMIYSMDLVKVIPMDKTDRKFILYTLKYGGFKEYAISMSNGSTVLHLSKKALPTFVLKLPPKNLRLLFNEYALSIQARISLNYHSMKSLMALRDTLLPKLMSGEVRVKLD